MTTTREGIFVDALWTESAPLPASVAPPVAEVGLTSAPLTSLAFFLGSHCAPWNEDFLACKQESNDPYRCLKEGRKVTRCSLDLYVGLWRTVCAVCALCAARSDGYVRIHGANEPSI
jgi:NADH dehydrogenase (ubiquinone) 1 alpha subcomplex subunit 8